MPRAGGQEPAQDQGAQQDGAAAWGAWTKPRNRWFRGFLWGLLIAGAGLHATPSRADVLFAVRVLREGGCGGILPGAPPLHHNPMLDRTAEEWAVGRTLSAAADISGYKAVSAAGLHVRGPDEAMTQLLKRSGCRTLVSQGLHEIGLYRRGFDVWIVLATGYELTAGGLGSGTAPTPAPAPRRDSAAAIATPAPDARAVPAPRSGIPTPATVPTPAPRSAQVPAAASAPVPAPAPTFTPVPKSALSPILATRALQLVNNVRSRGTHCGKELFGPAPPVALSETLSSVALGHASDMAQNNYFEHEDSQGKSPADRVRATGYKEKLVGENIAYGPKSVDEVVQGWLDSPGHCENIMDPRFAEMGLGYAKNQASKPVLYWVQVLAAPRSLATASAPGR